MTKNTLIKLANERGITDTRYSGKQRILYIKGDEAITSAFISFLKNTNNFITVLVTNQPTIKLFKGFKKLFKRRSYNKYLFKDTIIQGTIFVSK